MVEIPENYKIYINKEERVGNLETDARINFLKEVGLNNFIEGKKRFPNMWWRVKSILCGPSIDEKEPKRSDEENKKYWSEREAIELWIEQNNLIVGKHIYKEE